MIKEQEIPKYLKQKESNVSKAKKKSKHRHQYEECLIQYKWNFKSNAFAQEEKEHMHTSLSSYCTICGKINDRFKENKSIVKDYIRTIDSSKGKYHSRIPDEELYEKYHDKLPVFFVKDIYKKRYINLKGENK